MTSTFVKGLACVSAVVNICLIGIWWYHPETNQTTISQRKAGITSRKLSFFKAEPADDAAEAEAEIISRLERSVITEYNQTICTQEFGSQCVRNDNSCPGLFVGGAYCMLSPAADARSPRVEYYHECCLPYRGGCDILFKVPFIYKAGFQSSCQNHQWCYECGVKYGVGEDVCNFQFKRMLSNDCKQYRGWDYCDFIAESYYTAVMTMGGHTYLNTAADFC